MVSDNTLAGLVVVAIIVAVGGMLATLSAVTQLGVTGAAASGAGNVTVTVGNLTAITLPNYVVSFGTMTPDESNDTTDDSPYPFTVQNEGNVNVNVSINGAGDLWITETNPSAYYQFKCGDSGEFTCTSGSATSWTNMPNSTTQVLVIHNLTWGDSENLVQVEINVTVPHDETSDSARTSTINFTAVQAY